ncbi:patatin-like phospholipase family protein [Desulfogranum marinum]|uniref:patatin-like phospholipase family protein n=1 Tax=Desulfogranum marinum TaxID=453220 RepID=UPI0019665CFA|nr:patatin-like phospholipase family protein [Desulfogranum marinum]MBM9515201.1 patatin-like phospholipase family protein [Desulfogranum marinum]
MDDNFLTLSENNMNQVKISLKNRGEQASAWSRIVLCLILLTFASGCASYGIVQNKPSKDAVPATPYSLKTWANSKKTEDTIFFLTFSGGGTRAAAMAYGVLQELRDTLIFRDGQQERLLDRVTHISSVSGGSFTAAYYGLHGDKTFDTFESEFLRKDVEGVLTKSLVRPSHWFSSKGRTERAIDYYNEILFHDATFADMMQPHRPMIIINASDLAYGLRFSFIQDYFNFLCSDLRSFPVARAVAASSAVPVVFNPVVIENFEGCSVPQFNSYTTELAQQSSEFVNTLKGLQSYSNKKARKYIHFVDGGITDNMGLRAMTDVMALSGGPSAMINKMQRKIPRRVVFLSVNASTEHNSDMDKTTVQPSMLDAMNAMTDIQLHRYNDATVDKVKSDLDVWTAKISTPEHPVASYFIQLGFEETPQLEVKLFLNKIPTSFSLTDEQVDTLISSARVLLRTDPEFKQLLADLANY